MSRYIGTRIRTKSTMRPKSRLTAALVSGCVTLGLASCISCLGHKQDYVPSVSPTLPLTAESLVEEAPSSKLLEVTAKYSSYEVTLVCQTVYGEARGCSDEEQMLVAWCICNRADRAGARIEQVVTAPHQFDGYSSEHPVTADIYENVVAVLSAWSRDEEALVLEPYATTSEYLYFVGDGAHNWFREEY